MPRVYVYDPTALDSLSSVRGVGRYLQILKESLPNATFGTDFSKASNHEIFINPFFNVASGPLIKSRIARRQIAVIHDVIPLLYPEHFPLGIRGKFNLALNKASLRLYDQIITDSQKSKNDLVRVLKIKPEKIQVLYPAVSKAFFNPTTANHQEIKVPDKYCLYVGDATWNKNLVTTAQAVIISDLPCVFVGKIFVQESRPLTHPWQSELRRFLTVTKDNPQFIFPGFITDEALTTLYKNAVCNILISRDEGFGYSYFEAASQKTPSILSSIPVFKETARNTALFVPVDDAEAVADAIVKLSKNNALRKKLGQAAEKNTKKASPEEFKKSLITLLSA